MPYYQIQAYPTPILYVSQGKEQFFDYAKAAFTLSLATVYLPASTSGNEIGVVSSFTLVSANAGGPVGPSQTDSALSMFSLVSSVYISPVVSTQSDAVDTSYSLGSATYFSPQITTWTESPVTSFTLVSASST